MSRTAVAICLQTFAPAILLIAGLTSSATAQNYRPYGDYPTTAVSPGYPHPSPATYRPDPNQPVYYTRPGENRQQRAPWQAPNLPAALPAAPAAAQPPNYSQAAQPPYGYNAQPAPYASRPAATPAAAPPPGAYQPQRNAGPFTPPPPTGGPQYASPPDSSFVASNEPPPGQSISAALSLFEPAQRIAQVGDQPILAGDVMGLVNQVFEANKDKLAEFPPEELERQKELLTRQYLKQLIESKILYVAFLREIRSKAGDDKFKEIHTKIREDALKNFDEEKLDDALKAAAVTTPAELDQKLRQFGTSLQKQKEAYLESELGRAGVLQSIDRNPEITYDEMLAYYQEHIDEYQISAKARWEQITVRFENFPDKRAAFEFALARWKEIFYGGAPFAAVAKRHSQGYAADKGGLHDWTTKGSLASEPLDRAIFTYPLNKLSEIIEDDRGMHIIRVLERQDEGRVSFLEAQEEIKDELVSEKRNKQVAEHVAHLRKSVPVWTIFDPPQDSQRAVQRPPGQRGATR